MVQAVNEYQLSVADTVCVNIHENEPGKTILVSWTHQVCVQLCSGVWIHFVVFMCCFYVFLCVLKTVLLL